MHYMTCHKELGGSPHAHRTVKQWKESQRVREESQISKVRQESRGKSPTLQAGRQALQPAQPAAQHAQQNKPAGSTHGDSMRAARTS